MSRRWLLLVSVIGVGIPLVVARVQTLNGRDQGTTLYPNAVGGLVIEPDELNNGELWAVGEQSVRLQLKNVTNRSISVDGFETGCNCRKVRPKAVTVPAGSTREIEVVINSSLDEWLVGQEAVVRTFTIQPTINGREYRKGWDIHRTIRSPIATDVPAVMFGESIRKGGQPISRTIRLRAQVVGNLSVSMEPPFAQLELTQGKAPDVWLLQVTPRSDLDLGTVRGVLKVVVSPSELFPNGYELRLPVEGTVVGGPQ